MAINMGIGRLGENSTAIKRKFRFLVDIEPYSARSIHGGFVKTAKRPGWEVDEQELNFLNARTWIAGKHSYTEIEVVYIDAGVEEIGALIEWVGKLSNINNSVSFEMGTSFRDYGASVSIRSFDGCGNEMETWTVENAWPKTVDFGELDYSSSEEMNITVTLRYDQVNYVGICPPVSIHPSCTGCS